MSEAEQSGAVVSADRRASDAVIPLDTGLFTAAEVEARTRVPAATLRQWERRYGLPNPHRADNGYRLYSLSDLACIEFIRNRINEGVPAGRAVELYRLQQERGQDSAGEARPLPLARADELARDLTNATIAGDTTRAQEVLAAAHGSMPLESVLLHVIQPSLVEIGERWFRGEVSVAHEHRASAFLRGRLHALLDLAGQARIGPAVVVACAPRERHEIGSLILTIFLRRAGLNAHYLGADMPLDDLIRFAREVKAEILLLSAMTDEAIEALEGSAGRLAAAAPTIGFGGQAFNRNPAKAEDLGGHYMGPDAARALEKVLTLLATRRP